jgi:hypothetical protein
MPLFEAATEKKYQESVTITGAIYSFYKKGTFLWPAGEKSCVVKIGKKKQNNLTEINLQDDKGTRARRCYIYKQKK